MTSKLALLGGVSMLALGFAAPAMAQAQQMETIVVTGQRAAIESAIRIKENADQIVDSIVADDAGKLPDRSITEVLQRVSGVTITHFNNPSKPDSYTVEGSGPSVRGLPGGMSTINGHSAFSSNGGRNILWSDVPAELMAGVDVFKTYTPDQIEGGLGGTIALRTHLPFDFDGTKFGGRVGFSYGDLVKQGRPVASAMGSTRFDTKWGEMGLLVNVSYDDYSYRSDSIQTELYFPHTNVVDNYTLALRPDPSNATGPMIPTAVLKNQTDPAYASQLAADPNTPYWYDPNNLLKTYWLPGGFDYHTAYGFHQRGGGNIAFQWRPSDKLSIHARVFTSVNEEKGHSYSYSATSGSEWANITFVPDPSSTSSHTLGGYQLLGVLGSPAPTPTDPLYHVYDSNNYLALTNTLMNPQNMTSCTQPGQICSGASTYTDASESFSHTTDMELGANWTPNDNWLVRTAVDFIYSKSNSKSLNVTAMSVMPAYGVDLSGNYPQFLFNDPAALRNSSTYYWNRTMPDTRKNYGQELQANIDVTYHVNRGIFKDIKFGWRGDIRTEHDQSAAFKWQGLSPAWGPIQYYWSSGQAVTDTALYQFPNFFRGEANLPGPALFVDVNKVEMLDDAYFQYKYNCSYNGDANGCTQGKPETYVPQTFTSTPLVPSEAKRYKTVNVAAYFMATFAKDSVFGMPLSGNVGARLVYVDNQANGFWTASGNSQFRFDKDGPLWSTSSLEVPLGGGKVSWTLLPAFNVQIMPTDQTHIRLAGSVTAQQPGFANLGSWQSVGTQSAVVGPTSPLYDPTKSPTNQATVNVLSSFRLNNDNPRIKPEIGRNLDLSFEWYGQGADAHISGFYKSIKNKTTKMIQMETLPWNLGIPDLPTDPVTHAVTDYSQCVKDANNNCTFTANGTQILLENSITQTTVNSDKEAVIRGFEVGFTKYFDWDFVPSPLKGFGFAGNYTYIDSRAPGSFSLDMFGTNIAKRLPMEGLSHHSYNAQLMYDREPISFRLAYNWRSKYLLMASGYNTSPQDGIGYKGSDVGIACHVNSPAVGGTGGNVQEGNCNYALPVWSKSFGSLDAGMDYSIDENWKLSIQSQNLLNTKQKTTMGIDMPAYVDSTGVARPAQREMPRNWFTADRRVSIDLRFNY
jgi:TonB-dependent receptor